MNFAALPPGRRFPRAHLHATAQVNVAPGHTVAGEIVTLSQGGAFVTGVATLAVGALVDMWLLIPRVAIPLRATARVLYVLPARGRYAAGAGFEFTSISDEHRARVMRTVERLRFAP